jgi:hypothetical protein
LSPLKQNWWDKMSTLKAVDLQHPSAAAANISLASSGNVGIGTSSPQAIFHLERNFAGEVAAFINNPNAGGYSAVRMGNSDRGTNGDHLIYGGTVLGIRSKTGAAITFEPAGTERARIDTSGNLLVGKTSTANNATGFYVAGSGNADHGMVNVARPPNTTMIQIVNSSGNTVVGQISQNGSNTTYSTSSDYRLKENIAPMTGALSRVAALKPCVYTWKATGETDEGFIAHELAEVCPSAVTGEKDAVNEDGSIKPQGIDTSFLVATLTAAIQELKAQNDELKARVATLEAK